MWRWRLHVCIQRRQGSMSDACHIAQCYHFIMSELLARGVMLSVGSHLRNQVGLADTAFDIMFILVCAMWHNVLLQQMGKFCISDNCRFLWLAITIKFHSEKLVSLSYDLRSRNRKWGCNISPTGTNWQVLFVRLSTTFSRASTLSFCSFFQKFILANLGLQCGCPHV